MIGTAAVELEPVPTRRRRLRLADWRIRTKLALLVALPLLLTVGLTVFTAVSSLSAAAQTDVARQLVDTGLAGAGLGAQLQRERVAAAMVFARDSAPAAIEQYRRQGETTDRALAGYAQAGTGLDATTGPAVGLRRLDEQLAVLPLLREQVRGGKDATESLVVFRYAALVSGLLGYAQALSQADVDADTADRLRAVSTLSRGIEALGVLQVTVVPAIRAGQLTPVAQQQVIAADAAFTDNQDSFRQLAPASWQALVTSQPGSEQILTGERLQAAVVRTDAGAPLELGVRASGWVEAMNARMLQLHQLEDRFLSEQLQAVTRQRDAQRRDTLLLGAVVLACLVLVAGVGWRVTRSMTVPLDRLADEATRVATIRLPTMEHRLNTRGVSRPELDTAIKDASRPLPVPGGDEIGRVIAAFNDVTSSAARVAAGQAEYRGIVAQAFQTQALEQQRRIDRITASLDVREREEESPDKLHWLFELDRQVTTLLRSVGTMQLFAGSRVGRPWPGPMRLTDVVTAAVGRVEGYQRVEHTDIDLGVMIDGDLAEELVHLLVELLTNGLMYSQTSQPVEVTGKPIRDRLYLEVRDYGLGLSAEQQQDLQHRIDAFQLDEFTARHYGLAAVGLIAARRGIAVRLNSLAKDGTSVEIAVPAPLFWTAPLDRPVAEDHRADPPALSRLSSGAPTGTPVASGHRPAPPQRALVATVVTDRTRELHTVAAPSRVQPSGVLPGGPPPDWPMPAPIYDTVVAGHPLFNPAASVDQIASPSTLEWRPAEQHAASVTASGLPKRVPATTATVDLAPALAAAVPQQRDPRQVKAQWSSFGVSSEAMIAPK